MDWMREMVVSWARALRLYEPCVAGRSMPVEMVRGERRVVDQPKEEWEALGCVEVQRFLRRW